jgi:hypothetical protein
MFFAALVRQGSMVWQGANLKIQQCLSQFEQLKNPCESADYRAWKLKFLRDRLKLCLWLAFICLLTFIVRDIYDAIYPLQEMADIRGDGGIATHLPCFT